ncbi:ABC-type multidrug transport system, ATPase component [Thermoplasmatales archaeon SCGC AB-539-N05]|nr:ABC-type multidrug transport system, ATPase component [Thermoplasmatales archaeon SCGC AB-539-N05]
MITKTVICPSCKNTVTIQGNSGEKIYITCPKCNAKGRFTFPEEKTELKTTAGSFTIEVDGLTKTYKDLKAVDNLSLNIRTGEIFGLLGPNGAGKTTIIKAILSLIHVNSGKIKINGFDMKRDDIEAKKKIGYLPERVSFYDNLTPLQTLNFFCELKGADKSIARSLIKDVGLEDAINRKVGTFSKGMVQLLGVAQTTIGNPSIYILDEPMAGLDARWVKTIREKIKMLNKKGATVVFSSHILTEVEALCDRVAIIDKGKIIAEDTVANLNKYLKIKPRLSIFIKGLDGKVPDIIKDLEGVESVEVQENILFITCEPTVRSKVITSLEGAGYEIVDIKTIEPSLEEAFVKLISNEEGGT